METGMYMLPVRCKGCNTVFDLWQTLQDQESKGGVFQAGENMQKLNQSFCPRCRNAVLSELGEIDEYTLTNEDTDDSIQEFELTLDFE